MRCFFIGMGLYRSFGTSIQLIPEIRQMAAKNTTSCGEIDFGCRELDSCFVVAEIHH
jgi:hypothetical protein